MINLEEFTIISTAWLSHDPNDPVCDPNHPNYVSDPNDPGYIDPDSFANWNAILYQQIRAKHLDNLWSIVQKDRLGHIRVNFPGIKV